MTKQELIDLLQGLEFGFVTRYGYACPVCHGSERYVDGIHERGPDEGHEEGCRLRKALLEGLEGDGPPMCANCYAKPAMVPVGGFGDMTFVICRDCDKQRSKYV